MGNESVGKALSEEHKVFTVIILLSTLLLTVLLLQEKMTQSCGETLFALIPGTVRKTLFQVVSLITTTGFATADYMLWPLSSNMILLFLMFCGGCAGSTAGGFKIVRLLILAKSVVAELKRSIYPRSVQLVKLDHKKLGLEAWRNCIGFSIIFFATLFSVALFLPLICKMDLTTALFSSVTAISNVGPGFGACGPSGSFAWMNTPSKLLLSLEMIAGRLELYTILILFMPSFWKR